MITGRRSYPKWLVRGLIVFAIGMTAFGAVVSREHHAVERERNGADSRYVALEAKELEGSDPSLAMQLALIAYRLSQTTEARSALLDVTAGEMPTRLTGRPGRTRLALGDDGHRVAIAYQGNDKVALYGLHYAQLTPLAVLPGSAGSAEVDSVAISDNGHLLAIGDSGGHVTLWGISSAMHPRRLAVLTAGRGAASGVGFSPAGGALAAADADGTVQRWSLADVHQPALSAPLTTPGSPALSAVSYSPDGKLLAAVGAHGTFVVWPAHAGTSPQMTGGSGSAELTAVAFSPDGRTFATGAQNGAVALWNVGVAGPPRRLSPGSSAGGSVNSLAFSRDGRYLAAGTYGRSATVWSTSDGKLVASLPHPASVTGTAFTDGDRRLITADTAGTTMLWQFPAPSTYTFGSALAGVSYSATSPQLSVMLKSGRTDDWDVVNEWRPAPQGAWYAAPPSDAPAHAYWITPTSTATTTTPTATTPTTGTTTGLGGAPLVFNPDDGNQALRRTEAQTTVLDSALSDSGEFFAAAGADHLVWLWDVTVPARPKLLAKLSGFTAAATAVVFSANSHTLYAGSSDHTVRIWSLSQPTAPKELTSSPLIGPLTAVTRLALSPDNHVLAVATVAGHVWLWSVATPAKARVSATLTAARGRLTVLSFSPSDNVLVAAGSNRRLTFWHYRPFEAVNRICALAGTPITYGEWQRYVPGAAYRPPCLRWRAPASPTSPSTATATTAKP